MWVPSATPLSVTLHSPVMVDVAVARVVVPSSTVTVVPASGVPEIVNDALRLQLLLAGEPIAGAAGGAGPATVNPRVAGVGSAVPDAAVARTRNV